MPDRSPQRRRAGLLGRLVMGVSERASRRGLYIGARSGNLHVALYRRSNGRIGGCLPGWPQARIVLVDHVGAKSGIRRTSPLIYQPHSRGIAVVASKAGQATNPAWFHNLRANPETTVQVGAERRRALARVSTDQERAELWPAFVAAYPSFDSFQRAAAERSLPILILEFREGSPGAAARRDDSRVSSGGTPGVGQK